MQKSRNSLLLYQVPRSRVCGITVLELLVVITTIGILMAILVPAVQNARVAARGAECKNKLKNIGIACHNMQSSTGYFPSDGKPFIYGSYEYSCLVQLLPFVEQKAVFDQLDFAVAPPSNWHVIEKAPVRLWHCPMEGDLHPQYASYLGNRGVELKDDLNPMLDGFLGANPGLQPRDFIDGLSNTVAFSEVATPRKGSGLFDGFVELNSNATTHESWVLFRDECRRLQFLKPSPPVVGSIGWGWVDWSSGDSTYSHVFPPGSISCKDMGSGLSSSSIPTATSRHGGYVHGLMVDGSVARYSFSTDAVVWQHLGLRADGAF